MNLKNTKQQHTHTHKQNKTYTKNPTNKQTKKKQNPKTLNVGRIDQNGTSILKNLKK